MKHIYFKSILLFCIAFQTSLQLFAQDTQNEKLGKASDFIKNLRISETEQSKQKRKFKPFKLDKAGKLTADLKRFANDQNLEIYSGAINGEKNSNVMFEIKDNKISGTIFLFDKKQSFKYATDTKGDIILEETDINKTVCVELSKAPAKKSKRSASSVNLAFDPVKLHSNKGAPVVIYLDFDGETINSPVWGQFYAQPSDMISEEMYVAWSIVAEDFAPFNVDVTTERATYDATPWGYKHMNIFTITDQVASGTGGTAIINSFAWSFFCPSWTFNLDPKIGGESASHEIGHALGLIHDGLSDPYTDYYGGHNNWATIMGAAFLGEFVQWSKGEYHNATNKENDLAIITRPANRVEYRKDDGGSTIASAFLLKYENIAGGIGTINHSGVIAKTDDIDVLRFETNGGYTNINISTVTAQYGYPFTNLNFKADLLNSAGVVIDSLIPTRTNASFSRNLAAGTYFIRIDGVGSGNPQITGYSDYGSLGTYTITGTVNSPVTGQFIANISYPQDGAQIINLNTVTIRPILTSPNAYWVEYFDNGVKIGESNNSPAYHYFNITGVSEGVHTVYIRARDSNGNYATSAPITFTVYRNLAGADPNTSNKKEKFIWDYYEGIYSSLPNFNALTPLYSGLGDEIKLADIPTRSDNFAIRYSGFIEIPSESLYKFSLSSDDGSKLYIGNKLIINNDGNHSMQEMSGKVALAQGYYPFTLEYYEATGSQDLKLNITDAFDESQKSLNFYHNDIEVLPSFYKVNQTIQGINYEYYEGTYDLLPANFNTLTYKSVGKLTNFGLGIPGRRADNFAVRFNALINVPLEGLYKFYTKSDDGTKLYIDNNLVVINDGLHDMSIEKMGSIWLGPGRHQIKIEYFEKTGGEDISVSYSGPGIYKQVIPANVLSRDPITGEQLGYLEEPRAIVPGYINAENYDQGGEGYAYHDLTPGNQFNLYRNDGVDITEYMSYGYTNYWVSNIQDGEWLEYTVSSAIGTYYDVFINCSSGNGTSKLHFERNNTAISPVVNIPVITDGSGYQTVRINNVFFAQGEQVIRVYFDKGGFMLDYFYVQDPMYARAYTNESSSESDHNNAIAFPNPFEDHVNFDLAYFEDIETISVIDLNGVKIWETSGDAVNEELLTFKERIPAGMYILEIKADNRITHSTIVKK
jgi:hypothetical protein